LIQAGAALVPQPRRCRATMEDDAQRARLSGPVAPMTHMRLGITPVGRRGRDHALGAAAGHLASGHLPHHRAARRIHAARSQRKAAAAARRVASQRLAAKCLTSELINPHCGRATLRRPLEKQRAPHPMCSLIQLGWFAVASAFPSRADSPSGADRLGSASCAGSDRDLPPRSPLRAKTRRTTAPAWHRGRSRCEGKPGRLRNAFFRAVGLSSSPIGHALNGRGALIAT
jgi:hypothetical protein